MPDVAPIQDNFNAGEFSPLMAGRTKFERYPNAMKICKNMIPTLQGPVTRRPGTYFCDEVKDSTKKTRIVKFKYSTISAFALEFGDRYIRFKKNHAPIYDLTLTITGISAASVGVVSYTGTDPSNGDHVDISGVVGMIQVNGRRFVVSNVNAIADTFELKNLAGVDVDTSIYTAWGSGGTAKRVYTLTTTYLEADLFQLKFAQSADVLYIWHPDYPERQLSRVADNSWTIADSTFLDGPYLTQNATATTLTSSAFAPGAGVTITASSIVGINKGTGFQTTDVGRFIRMKQGSTWGYAVITARTTDKIVVVTIINGWVDNTAKVTWRLGLYSETTGYPACGTFYGDRLYRSGVPEVPERVDGSMVGDYLNMAPSGTDGTVIDSNAVSFRLNSNDVQVVRWMAGTSNGIVVGTHEGEWLLTPSNLNETITPTNINAKQSTSWGSEDVQPVQAGSTVLFVEAGARRLREANYLYYENVLVATDTTVLAEHITKGGYDPALPLQGVSTVALSGIVEIDFQKKKIPTVWAPRYDGVLLSMVYSKDDKVMGWQRHELGGFSDANHTVPAKVKSLCVIPDADDSADEVWMIVQRYISGRVVQYTEFLTPVWEQGNAPEDAFFVDCGLTYDGAATDELVGLGHLANETIQLLVDGATIPDAAVQDTGIMELTASGSVIQAGYTYDSDGCTLRFDAGSATGTAQGKLQRIHHVNFRLYDTGGMDVGPSFDRLSPIYFRNATDLMGQPVPLYTGDTVELALGSWEGGSSTEALICWRFNSPLPGTVVAVMPQMDTQDGT